MCVCMCERDIVRESEVGVESPSICWLVYLNPRNPVCAISNSKNEALFGSVWFVTQDRLGREYLPDGR